MEGDAVHSVYEIGQGRVVPARLAINKSEWVGPILLWVGRLLLVHPPPSDYCFRGPSV